jgi:arabinogalactan oligomer/maltooligosaccharide transport system permease protein
MSRVASHRKRWTVGLAAALVVGVGLSQWALVRTRAKEDRARAERVAVVSLNALAEIVARAGGAGESARRAVTAIARENGALTAVRAGAFDGLSLEASTAPGDTGDQAAPRRLAREEKSIYDQGQRLRAAVETNREEGGARKEEIEVTASASGGLALAAPLEKDDSVVGLVAVETSPLPPAPRTGWLFPVVVLLGAVAVFWVAAIAVGERRGALALIAVAVLVVAMFLFGRHANNVVAADVRATESAVAASVVAEEARAARVVQEASLGDARSLHPAAWNADHFRRPFGLVLADGKLDEARRAGEMGRIAASTARVLGSLGVLALAVLVWVGFGFASRLGATLKKHRQAYTYTFPALFGMLLLVFLPFLTGVLSFSDMSLYTSQAPFGDLFTNLWVGVKNFTDILGDFHVATRSAEGLVWNYQNIYWTLGITIIWTVTNVAYGVGMGLFLALILNTKGLLGRPYYRVLFILPWAMPNYITALIWKGMFHQQFGVFNQIIQMFGGTPVSWFERTSTSLFACIATNAWLSVPFMMVISLGALQSISADLYEAARVDGATRWQQFRSITLPSLKPALVPAVILSVIWTFNMFNIIYLVSAGEPGHSTEILITQAYKFAFEQYRYGYAAAYSMVIFAILLAYGIWQNKVTKATEGI